MGEYLRSWKRKCGIITLVLACIGAVWWARSFCGVDGAVVYGKWDTTFAVASARGQLEWQITRDTASTEKMDVPIWFARNRGKLPYYIVLNEDDSDLQWTWRCLGFAAGVLAEMNPSNDAVRFIVTPYWFFVLPLTVLSAWMLLSNCRPPITAKK